jgi:predicted dienelactone hydrolase
METSTMKRLTVLLLAGLLAACASGSNDDRNEADKPFDANAPRVYRADTGPSPVGAIPAATLRDEKRNRNVELSIEYPTRGPAGPVIIFSHGYGSSGRAYVGLSSYWASYGYVVIKPTHADSGKSTTRSQEERALWPGENAASYRDRVADVQFVIDSLEMLEQKFPELQGKMNREKIGVAGHSYGGLTAVMAAGAKTFVGETPSRVADTRIDAIVAMSPIGTDPGVGLINDSWNDIKIPALFMTGTRDETPSGQDPSWRREAFNLSAPGDKWFISIPGARNRSFEGIVLNSAAFEPKREASRSGRPDPADPLGPNDAERPPTSRDPNDPRPRDPNDPTVRDPYYNNDPRRNSRGRAAAMLVNERQIFINIKQASLAFWDAYLRNDEVGRKHLENLRTRTGFEVATR